MPMANAALAEAFAKGEEHGKSQNMKIESFHGPGGVWTVLIGYGHAAYALRDPQGRITIFGWRGYSSSTTQHMNKVRSMALAHGALCFESSEQARAAIVIADPLKFTVIEMVLGDP